MDYVKKDIEVMLCVCKFKLINIIIMLIRIFFRFDFSVVLRGVCLSFSKNFCKII